MRKSFLDTMSPERRANLEELISKLLQSAKEIPQCLNCGRRVACGVCCDNPSWEKSDD